MQCHVRLPECLLFPRAFRELGPRSVASDQHLLLPAPRVGPISSLPQTHPAEVVKQVFLRRLTASLSPLRGNNILRLPLPSSFRGRVLFSLLVRVLSVF